MDGVARPVGRGRWIDRERDRPAVPVGLISMGAAASKESCSSGTAKVNSKI